MSINYVESFSFDDLMLIPKYSEIKSRSEVNISVDLGKGIKTQLPFIPSNMKTITEIAMAKLIYSQGGIAIFHRFTSTAQQLDWLKEIRQWVNGVNHVGFSIGVKKEDYAIVDQFIDNGAKIILIDIAHGDSGHCIEMTEYVAKKYPKILLISGNVATGEGAARLWRAGADVVKVGIGAGSICLTRVNTGNGVPSMTTLAHCYERKLKLELELNRKLFIMQDGGCRNPGDVAKTLCFADLCMVGNLFSSTDEAPGEYLYHNGKKYKQYVGSSTHKATHKEGVEALSEAKGPAIEVVRKISEGIKSCCSYQGVNNLENLKDDPRFVKISSAGLRESHAHDVIVIQ